MGRLDSYGPGAMAPFAVPEERVYDAPVEGVQVMLGRLSIPTYVDGAELIDLNVGALGGFAANHDIKTVYVLNHPDEPAPRYTARFIDGRPEAITVPLQPWFVSSYNAGSRALALYFNANTANRSVLDHWPEGTRNVAPLWGENIQIMLINEVAASGAVKWRNRKVTRATLLRSNIVGFGVARFDAWFAAKAVRFDAEHP